MSLNMIAGKINWYTIDNADQIDSPALLIYPERVSENIRRLKSMIDDPARLRPHVKTHKSPDVTQLLMKAGIRKFKCATIAEAEMLGMCKAEDVLLAYQPVGPKLNRFISLVKQYPATDYSCLIDNIGAANKIAESAIENELVISVYIDLNTGMNRTGIAPGKAAIDFYKECTQLNGLEVRGIHAYDGHVHEADMHKRTTECNAAFAPVESMREFLTSMGLEVSVVAGGSPGFPIHALRKHVECSPGTFIYWDRGYQLSLTEQEFLPSALVMTRVISLPAKNKLCLDLGHKSIAAENPLEKRIYFLNAPDAKMFQQSEEHLVIEVAEGHSWKTGDVLYGLPFHICPTCALYESATTVYQNHAKGEWKILARDKKIMI